jgi:hypothetical protein
VDAEVAGARGIIVNVQRDWTRRSVRELQDDVDRCADAVDSVIGFNIENKTWRSFLSGTVPEKRYTDEPDDR